MAVNRIPTEHSEHDQLLIAALAAGDLTGSDVARATTLSAVCPECAQLLADLTSLAAATAALPAPRRTRDFRLTEDDSARLRPRGWRRALHAFVEPRLSFTRPLAMGLTTLGVAGLLLAAVPLPFGSAGAAPVLSTVGSAVGGGATQAAAPAASAAAGDAYSTAGLNPASALPAPTPVAAEAPSESMDLTKRAPAATAAPTQQDLVFGPSTLPGEAGQDGAQRSALAAEQEAPSRAPSPLTLLSAAFLVSGLGILALRWVARHTA